MAKLLPVAVVTGAGETAITDARRAGAEAVFVKPFTWDTIVDYLRSSKSR